MGPETRTNGDGLMMITHEVKVYGHCPVDGKNDFYDVTISTMQFLKVEDILLAINGLNWPLFQETMTQQLADVLGCHVRSVGYHSGIKTTCKV
jgi:hypothetical protein